MRKKQPNDRAPRDNATSDVPELLCRILETDWTNALVVARGLTILAANTAYAKLVGAESAEDVIGLDTSTILAPESLKTAEERYRQRLAGEKHTDSCVYHGHALDGTPISFNLVAVPWPEDPTLMLAIMQDVTERENGLEELRDSERLFKTIAEAIPVGVVLRNAKQEAIYVNDQACKITGYSRDEILADAHIAGLTDSQRKALSECRKRQDALPSGEFQIVFKDGRRHWIHAVSASINDEHGNYAGVCNTFTDITKQKQTQEALQARSTALEGFLSAFPDIYLRLDSDCVFLDCHAGQGSQLYASPEDFLGRPVEEVLPKRIAKMTRSKVNEVLRTGELNSYEYDLELEGEMKTYQARMSPFRDGVVVVVQDITERKRAERSLQQALADLEDAYRLEQDIMNNVTHEVRTPLTAVIGYTNMLLEGIAGPINEEQESMLRKTLGAAQALVRMIDVALEDTRLKSRSLSLRRKRSRPTLIAMHSVDSVLPQAREKGISLECTGPQTHRQAIYDPERIRTVLFNLLANAVKYTDNGGSITVMAADVDGGAEIIVADTGRGIPESEVSRVFDRFRQVTVPGQRKNAGFGLGLSIVLQAMEVMGGTLIVSTASGVGTAFTLYLPALEDSQSEQA